ncbi:MAG: ComF family protein, partial [Halieaceae bacterium]
QGALPLATASELTRLCGRCLTQPPAFDQVRAAWLYDPQLAALITAWKYHRDLRLTPLLASLLLVGHAAGEPPDLILAVPLHWRRLLWRGFNQSQELVAAAFGQQQPRAQVLVCKRRMHSPAQSSLGARQRNTLPAHAFTVQGRCDNLRVALVDDVMTTGATAHALSLKLKAAGASHVEVWCIARTPAPDNR